MKSNLRITAAARLLSLFMALTIFVTGCGSANTGDTTPDTNTESEINSEDSENVSVEPGSGDIVGDSSEETEGTEGTEITTEPTTESTPDADLEADTEAVPAPELTDEELIWQDRVVANAKNNLNVRAEANTDAKVVGKMEKGAYGIILEKGAEWTKIESGNVVGYVSNEYCLFGLEAKALAEQLCETIATVTTNGLRIRKEASTESKVITKVNKDEELVVDIKAEAVEGWVAVKYEDNTYYVSADYVTVDVVMDTALTKAEIAEKKRIEEEKRKAEEAKKLAAKYQAAIDSASDLDLLAALIYCEAGAESYEAQLAVGAVVVNRKEHPSYPNTIRGVIYQKGQFTPAGSGKVARILINKKATASCYKAAQAALNGEDNTNGCRSFRLASTGRAGLVIGKIVFFNNN